jgi:hypothetical protein
MRRRGYGRGDLFGMKIGRFPCVVAAPTAPPSGCYFHPCCPYALARCKSDTLIFDEIVPEQWAASHRARELQLPGIG